MSKRYCKTKHASDLVCLDQDISKADFLSSPLNVLWFTRVAISSAGNKVFRFGTKPEDGL